MTFDQMLLDYLVNISPVFIGVPDPFRVDHADGPLRAAIQTTGTIDPDAALPGDSQRLAALFGVVSQAHRVMVHAALTALFTRIRAEKDVSAVKTAIAVFAVQKPYSSEIAVKVSVFSLPAGTSEFDFTL